MRCVTGIVVFVLALAILVMFDWLNAREWVMDGLDGLQYGVEVLSEWGDTLQGKAEKTQAVLDQAQEAVEASKAVVEKIEE